MQSFDKQTGRRTDRVSLFWVCIIYKLKTLGIGEFFSCIERFFCLMKIVLNLRLKMRLFGKNRGNLMSLSILSIVGQIGVDNRYIGKEGRKGENNKESLLLLQK